MSVEKILISIVASLFQSIAATVIIQKITNEKMSNKTIFIFVLEMIYYFVSTIIIPNQIRFIMFIFTMFLLLYFIFKIKIKKSILYSIEILVIFSVSEILVTLTLVCVGIDSKMIINNMYYNLLASTMISILSIIIINIPVLRKLLTKITNLIDKNSKISNYLYVFIIFMYILVLKNGFELLQKSSYYINFLFVLFIGFLFVYIIKKELKTEQLQEVNSQMLNYVTKYEKIITEQGKANHEFKNQLMVIKGYAKMNDSKKLIDYLDSITDDAKKTHSSYLISQLNNFPDGGIKGLLYYKLSTMEDMNISYDINVGTGVKKKLSALETNMYKNITKVLGVLLDNAIEASSKSKNKKILIITKKNNDKITFSIYNTYTGKIDLNKIGTGYTTKGKGRGYGLRLVEDIIGTNRSFDINRYLEDNYYVTDLTVKIKNKK